MSWQSIKEFPQFSEISCTIFCFLRMGQKYKGFSKFIREDLSNKLFNYFILKQIYFLQIWCVHPIKMTQNSPLLADSLVEDQRNKTDSKESQAKVFISLKDFPLYVVIFVFDLFKLSKPILSCDFFSPQSSKTAFLFYIKNLLCLRVIYSYLLGHFFPVSSGHKMPIPFWVINSLILGE